MIYKTIELATTNKKNSPTISLYLPDNYESIDVSRKRKTIIICPGGGYEKVSNREAEPVALKLAGEGYNAVVLKYSVKPAVFPVALLELANAVHTVRKNAQEWNVDKDKIIVGGFSAGGHLACCLGTIWHSNYFQQLIEKSNTPNLTHEDYKPNGLLLCYPVISGIQDMHKGSFDNLLGENKGDEMLRKLSLEEQVSEQMPKTFLWHTFTDTTVPVENSLRLALKMKEHGVNLEMHIFNTGGHGISLANKNSARNGNELIEPVCQVWIDLFLTWLDKF